MTKKREDFLGRCLIGNVIPNGLKIELEASIGNHNEQFLTKWNEKLIKFSGELTVDVIAFCDTTITETTIELQDTNQQLKSTGNQEKLTKITTILAKNQDARKHNYKRNKDKKYYNLKYNVKHKPPPRSQPNGSNEEDNNNDHFQQPANANQRYNPNPHPNRMSYASAARKNRSNTNLFGKPNPRRNSNTNLTTNAAQTSGRQNHNTSNENYMLLKRVQQLEDQAEQQNTPPKTNTSNINNGTKNTNIAQSNVPGAPLQIQDMLEYITNTMETLNGFKTQLTQLQDTGQTHSGMS